MEFEIKGQQYRAAKLNAFAQQDVAVALAPVLSGLIPLLKDVMAGNGKSLSDDKNRLFDEIIPLVVKAVTQLSKEGRAEINHACLSVVTRQQGQTWSKIYEPNQRVMLFDDLNGLDLVKIVGSVVQDSLGDFFPALPASDSNTDPQPA
ncbi:phage tail assembly chaperone [Serratia proteamaculans]|uniref:phage tail assembly chaperone n=1 Tax=Serratia proteamaculans TaxID=28151 RepID=UPI003D024FCA